MEFAPRFQTRDRAQEFFGVETNSQGEESGTESEARARRKFQRTADDNDNAAFRKPTLPASAMRAQQYEAKSNILNRRRSTVRDSKPLLGPRPLETSSPGKRIVSEGAVAQAPRSFLPNSTSMPVMPALVDNSNHNRFSFGLGPRPSTPPKNVPTSFAYLPPVSFDDFHTNIASHEPESTQRSSQFAAPTKSSLLKSGELLEDRMTANDAFGSRARATQASTPRQSQVPNISRQPSNSRREALQLHAGAGQTLASTVPLSLRTRRQSQMPPATPPSSARTPRKSVGPGILTGMMNDRRREQDEPPSMPLLHSGVSRTPSLSKTSRRTAIAENNTFASDQPRLMTAARGSRTKSVQPPPRQPVSQQYSEPMPEQSTMRVPNKTTPGKAHLQRSTTPSSSGNQRQSGRMSGLGARTVSPTDARRLKRMSMVQAPPMPRVKAPPTPQPDLVPDTRSTARSPSLIPRKASMTPSSARETPDSGPRQYNPPFSLSTSSSYSSLRTANATGPIRISQSPSLSKLPTPKPRNVYSSADKHENEIVPPVPAIPKVYESPVDQIEVPFFHNVKVDPNSSTAPIVGSLESEGTFLSMDPSPESRKPSIVSMDNTHSKTPPTPDLGVVPEPIQAPTAHTKKSLQPLRLPPLNLLPLSTPTAAKIASFPAPSAEVERREGTPSNGRNFSKTPSTPMTASKATFSRRYDDDQEQPYALRSSSSHHALRSGYTFGQPDSGMPLPSQPIEKRQITPFASGSLPKTGVDVPRMKRYPTDEFTLGHQVDLQTSRPMGPRPRTASKSIQEQQSASIPNEESEAPISTTSLRRKLSMGWRRSSSKNASRHAAEQAQEAQQQMHAEMPPPKLPTSTTWSGPIDGLNSSTLPTYARASVDTNRRVPPNSQFGVTLDTNSSTKVDKNGANTVVGTRQLHSDSTQHGNMPRSTSWSILGISRTVGPTAKSSSTTLKGKSTPPPRLDRDDMTANEEMKRLAMKRRDVETAARETDELKKRATPKERMTPAQAIQASAGVLNIYEKGEIIDYKDGVYFCGTKHAKKHVGDISTAGTTNFGYDDERGDYNIVFGDHLGYRYEVIDVLGKGSFGQVVRCIDHKGGGLCAVKIIRNKKRFHQQALVEVNILNKLKEWDPDETHATLTITSSFYFRSHLCISTPCLSINLYEFIRAHSFTGFSLQLIRRFARQMLDCLRLLQSKRVIHCDLKPENILLCDARRADIRVIDFGSSCKTDEKVYTYIQSRFYRSPEVILGSEYGLGIDMWSFGCILAELFTGYPIFPGENEQEQLACIMEIFGPPSRDIIEKCSRRKLFFDSALKPRVTVSSKGRRRRPSSKSLSASLKCEDEAFLDFITQCLRWDPERRLRPDQAGSHPFITNEPMKRMPERPRVRNMVPPTAPGPTGGIPSPVKRVQTTSGAISTSTSNAFAQTPSKDTRPRPLPDTPSTAIRGGLPLRQQDAAGSESPVKTASRRQSSMMTGVSTTSSQSLAVAGSKRASNGAFLQQNGFVLPSSSSLPRVSSGRVDLAGAAARDAVARWR